MKQHEELTGLELVAELLLEALDEDEPTGKATDQVPAPAKSGIRLAPSKSKRLRRTGAAR